MTRFEKKCFVGSAALHALLAIVFLFGSAFFSSKKRTPSLHVITLAAIPTDKMISTGGSPKGAQNPAPAAALPPPPVEPPKIDPPKPEPAKPEVKPEIEKPKEIVKPKPVETKKELVKTPPKEKGEMPAVKKELTKKPAKEIAEAKPARTINTNVVKRSSAEVAVARAAAEAEAKRRAEYDKARSEYAKQLADYNRRMQAINSQINGVIGGVGRSLGDKTVVELPAGDGGVAYMHWGSLVGERYKAAVYESHPQSDEDSIAVIHVTISRSGSVRDAKWVRKTGNSLLDKAVERAMKTVRAVPPFPEGATDSERSFKINIGFEAKRVTA
jgi:colicin import membrane protein